MSNPLGDELARRVRHYVASQVPPQHVDTVTYAVCMTVVTLMQDPRFLNELRVVNELRQENVWLRNQVAILQTTLDRYQPARKKAAPRKPSPARKKVSKSAQAGFRQGVRDMKGTRR